MTAQQPRIEPRSPRPAPQGAKRWGWYSVAWAGWFAIFAATEGMALWRNRHRHGLDDWQHRTLSENVWAIFATHPDDFDHAPWGKTRRLALITGLGWLTEHFKSNGRFV